MSLLEPDDHRRKGHPYCLIPATGRNLTKVILAPVTDLVAFKPQYVLILILHM